MKFKLKQQKNVCSSGAQPNSICESFSQVTIMFVNTVDFNVIVNNSEPSQIINFINSTVNIYDKIVSTFDRVHKVLDFPNTSLTPP